MLKRILRSTIQKSSGNREDLSVELKTIKNICTSIPDSEKDTIPSPPIEKKEVDKIPTTAIQKENSSLINTAQEKIELEKQTEKDHHNTEKKLLEHCLTAEKLSLSTNWEPANNTLSTILEEWQNLDSDNSSNYPELKERFDTAYNRFKNRYDNHINTKQLISSRDQLCDEIEKQIQFANTESAENRIREIQDCWQKSEKIPPRYFEILNKKYNKLITEFHKAAELLSAEAAAKAEVEAEERLKVAKKEEKQQSTLSPDGEKELTTTIEELCNQLKQHIDTDDTRSSFSNVREIQDRWEGIKNGRIKDSYSDQFKKLFRSYFTRLKFIQQKEDWARWENYTNKHLLCEQAENLLNEKDFYKTSKDIKTIWDKWRKIGSAPKEKNDIVWNRFNRTRKELNHRCKVFFNNLHLEKLKSLEAKTKLCEDAEKIKGSNDWEHTAGALKIIQKSWKDAGRAPQPQNDELFQRLRIACNYFFEKRSAFYAKLHERQAEHKNRKKELCLQAEELLKLSWKDAFKRIKELRNQWNSSPPASRKDEQTLWSQFNKSIDNFINKIENERPVNLRKKEELCQKIQVIQSSIESSFNSTEANSTLEEILSQWRKIGPAPKEKDKELNSMFDSALNKFKLFLQEKQFEAHIEYRKKLLKKESLITQLEAFATSVEDCFTKNGDQIKEIQDEWGGINLDTSNKEEELLEKRFTETCNALSNGQKEYFKNIIANRQNNLKAKRKLCIQLEHLTGISVSKDILQSQKSNTLADEIKFSIENNFAINDKITEDGIFSKYQNIQKKWNKIGPIPIDYYEKINIRYDRACNSIEQKNSKGSY